jgi:hypothetical protein
MLRAGSVSATGEFTSVKFESEEAILNISLLEVLSFTLFYNEIDNNGIT